MYSVLSAPVNFLAAAIFLQLASVGFPSASFIEGVGGAFVGVVAVVWAKTAVVLKRAVRARAEKSFMRRPHLNQAKAAGVQRELH
jgi:hypothetical protein